jgi:hypothetical protein
MIWFPAVLMIIHGKQMKKPEPVAPPVRSNWPFK